MNVWGKFYSAVIAVGIISIPAYQYINWKYLNAEEWAAWVQAIGSVVAIIGAFIGLQFQHKKDLQREQFIRCCDDIRRLNIIMALLVKTRVIALSLRHEWSEKNVSVTDESYTEFLEDCKVALDALPVFEVPDADVVIHITTIPRSLRHLTNALVALREKMPKLPPAIHKSLDDLDFPIAELMRGLDGALERCQHVIENFEKSASMG